ncbi:MAG: serine hydrolase domain-containing protein [Actinomycetota bacterium]
MSALDTLLSDHIGAWPVEHAAAAVTDGSDLLGAAGDTDRPFDLASVTKPLAALAVLIAVEEETVSLDDPAGPEGSTVAHLLAHASGLSPDSADDRLATPGAKRIYSNAGFDVLGEHVAAAADMTFADYLHLAVIEPLGLRNTTLDGSPAKDGRASVADVAVVARELLDPTLIARETLDAATTVAFAGLDGVVPGYGRQSPADWGLGFELKDGKDPHWTGSANSAATFGHFGRCGTFFWVDPEARVALVAFADREFDRWAREGWPALSDAVLEAVGRA